MGALSHWLIALSYSIVATVVAASLMAYWSFGEAVLAGGLIFLACVQVHHLHADRQRKKSLQLQIRALRGQNTTIESELSRARVEVREIYTALQAAGGFGGKQKEVIDELKVLHNLVQQLWKSKQASPATPPPRGEALREVVAAPVGTTEPDRPLPVAAGPSEPVDPATMLNIVRTALASGRVDLFLQPIVTLPNRRRRFYECYSRIRAEDGSHILPEQYLAVAEQEGLIAAIDNMLLFRCMQLIRKARAKNPEVGFFCNIPGTSLSDPGYLADLVAFVGQHADLAGALVFELAECDLPRITEATRLELDKLSDKGVRFSLDKVTQLPLDGVALARDNISFVKVEAGRMGDPSTSSPSALRRSLDRHGIALIIEKLETEKDLVELLDHDIPYGQGYLFGAPRLSQAA
jgi:cyclic-di-GMP phosphodiesterase, flagellum assembly factor TipF